MAEVKTYRVLKDGMRVGDSVRNFGDFMPEAESLPTLRTLLNSNVIEKVYVDEKEYKEWEENQKKRDEALLAGLDPDEDDIDEDDDPDMSESSESKKTKAAPKVKRKVAKKKTVKTKKGKSNGEGAELHSETV